MRGAFVDQGGLFSYIAPEARVPANHPLRKIRELVRDVLDELNRSLGSLYANEPSWWNDGGQKQFANNCYNYSTNYRTDTFALTSITADT